MANTPGELAHGMANAPIKGNDEKEKAERKRNPVQAFLRLIGKPRIVEAVANAAPQTKGFGSAKSKVTDGSTYQRMAYVLYTPLADDGVELPLIQGVIYRYMDGNGGDKPTPAADLTTRWDVSFSGLKPGKTDQIGHAILAKMREDSWDAFCKLAEEGKVDVRQAATSATTRRQGFTLPEKK